MKKVEDLLRDGNLTVLQIIERMPLDELDEAISVLLKHKPADEVCGALRAFIATAPLSQFQRLRDVFRKHCP